MARPEAKHKEITPAELKHEVGARRDLVVTLSRKSEPRLIPYGDDFLFEKLPAGTRVILPPPPLDALPDPDTAIRYALLHPLNADPLRMEQVFTNLTDNALKFTTEGGTVTLGAAPSGGDTLLWVSDTGQGILSSHLPHIFERFYRVDKGRSRDVGGTGLGLSIVKHIALAHGGTVEAESTFGKGTTIRLRLPSAV